MAKITISYRREDSGIIVGRIFDRLVAHYGTDTVFRDIDNIPPGIDFREYINEALSSTDILLAVIGPDWAGKTSDGRTRIAEPTDFVRIEVEAALPKRIPVVPVLVAKATMPNPNDLPDALQDFAYRNAIKVDAFEDFDDHLRRLMRSLDRLLQSAGVRPPRIEVQKGTEQERDKAVGDVTALGAKQDEPQEAEKAARSKQESARREGAPGLSPEQIPKAEELANWDFIKTSTNSQEFRDHLARFPKGVTERMARTNLEALVWAGLPKPLDALALRGFIEEFPNGVYAAEATTRLAELQRQAAASRCRRARRGQTQGRGGAQAGRA